MNTDVSSASHKRAKRPPGPPPCPGPTASSRFQRQTAFFQWIIVTGLLSVDIFFKFLLARFPSVGPTRVSRASLNLRREEQKNTEKGKKLFEGRWPPIFISMVSMETCVLTFPDIRDVAGSSINPENPVKTGLRD